MSEEYASFLPEVICRTVARHPSNYASIDPPLREQHIGVCLFADVSGFTKFSEQLAQKGPAGAEELGFYLNAYLERLGMSKCFNDSIAVILIIRML
jgi:hypothetical protein